MNNLLGEPAPPPPALVAGLRSLLLNVPDCDTPCLERGEDWFEQGMKWGASSVTSMVRLGYVDAFVGALALPCCKSSRSGLVPMVATDCGPLVPTPAPARYKCVNSTCVAGTQGVALHKCKKACG